VIDTLVLEVTGIVVSGVVGPVVVTMAVTRGEHRHLEEVEAERDRDDLLRVLEEGGQLLGSIALDMRQLARGLSTDDAELAELEKSASRVYLLRQRLLFRLRLDDPIVEGLDRVLDALMDFDWATAEAADYERLAKAFEDTQRAFLDVSRRELATRNFVVKRRRK